MTIQITKRDGTKENLDIEKIHKVVTYACSGINGVSASEVELKSQLQFFDGMKTSDIQETLIKAAGELISEDTPNYQYVAGRLINYALRKEVYDNIVPPSLYDHTKKVCDLGYYTSELLEWFTKEEFEIINSFIDHDRDDDFTYVAMEQFREKYLVRNRVLKKVFETPQFCYVLIAATLFHDYPKETRMKWIREYYDAISKHVISLPTPIMAGVRTTDKQFSSCVTISSGDSLDSINATSAAIVDYVSKKAGIGINVGRIRAKGSPIRNGATFHTGIVPFIRYFWAATKSCSQGSIRDGSATVFFPIWHLEVEDLIVLKNNKGTEDSRIRGMDYAVQINKLFYERLIEGKDITLFCPNDVPELYDAFFADQVKFKELYEAAEKNKAFRKKKVKAVDLFSAIAQERKDTGRLYIMNVDHVNEHGAFKPEFAPVRQSNLCMEINLPTTHMGEDDSLISLCTLSAINWGKIDSPEDFKKPCELAVRGLDAILSYQKYPVEAAFRSTQYYRPLGVGIINFAHWLAKNGLTYEGSKETYKMVDEFAEAWSYYLIKASCDLAKEFGACEKSDHTKYSDGIVPIDTYNKNVDAIVSHETRMNWNELRGNLKAYGIRNATLMALMPAETSAQISNSTNGIEPPRGFMSFKESKSTITKQIVPGYPRLKNKYQLLWDISSPEGYLNICAILQKYIDQSISVNTSYNPKLFKNEKIPLSVLIKDILNAYKTGNKCLYYSNTYDGATDADFGLMQDKQNNVVSLDASKNTKESSCESGACTL